MNARENRRAGLRGKQQPDRSRITRKAPRELAAARRGNTSQRNRDRRHARCAQVAGNLALFFGGGQ